MAAYRRVYDLRHLQADCQEPGSAPEPYARQLSMGFFPWTDEVCSKNGVTIGSTVFAGFTVVTDIQTNTDRLGTPDTRRNSPPLPKHSAMRANSSKLLLASAFLVVY